MAPSAKSERDNLFWADFIRVVVIFGVVLVHVAADVITEWGALPKDWWWAANIYDSLARGCVPMFVMLSGALLLPKVESLRDFFRKRFNRIIIPFIAWTVLYLLWKKHFYEPNLGLSEALRRVAENNVHFHLWFLYIIVGLYLVTPIFRVMVGHAKPRMVFYFLMLWFFMSSLLPFGEKLSSIFWHFNIQIKLPVEPATGFIGYFVLGYFLRQYAEEKLVPAAWVVGAASLFVCISGTYFLSRYLHSFQNLFYDNMSPNVVLYAASFFILIKYTEPIFERHMNLGFRNLMLSFSKASFGIYLIHPMMIDILNHGRWGFVLKGNVPHPIYMIPLTTAAIYFLSYAAIFVIQKIPVLKRIA